MTFQQVKFINGLNIEESKVLENIKANCERMDIPRVNVKKAVICGGGPSLADHINEIREKKARGFHVFTLNNAGQLLKQHGIQPNAQLVIDARPQNIEFVTPPDPEVTYFLGSGCDVSLFNALSGHKVHMVHILAVEGADTLIAERNPGCSILTSAPTSGLQALNLMHVLGYRIVHLYGYDSSHRGKAHHAYAQPLNDGQKVLEFQFRGKTYFSSGPMASQAEQFAITYRKWVTQGMDLQVFGDGLLPDMWRFHEEVRTHGSLEDREAVKYQRMWSIKDYRRTSPGELLVETFLQRCGVAPGARILDLGCGSGRAAKRLSESGYDLLAIDHAPNALDDDCRSIPFCVSNLWRLPANVRGDWGFCADVAEHIPPEKVDEVLACIAQACSEGAFFSISFRPDSFGECVGEVLHLTVRPSDWWREQLSKHFSNVTDTSDERNGVFVCKHKD